MNSEYVGAKITWNDFEKKKGEDAYEVEADKSGAGEDQKFETEELGWRIWDYDGTTIRIILEKPTTTKLILGGAAGYNNGVYLINEICRQCYGQYKADGKTKREGINVTNLRRSDIQKVSIYDFTKYSHLANGWKEVDANTDDSTVKFGSVKIYSAGNVYYPTMWEKDREWTYRNDNGTITGNDKECLLFEKENGENNIIHTII